MSDDPVEQRLTQTLSRRATALTGGPSFAVDEVVAAGRSIRRRRRLAAMSVATSLVLVTLGAFAAVSAGRRSSPPTGPNAASPSIVDEPAPVLTHGPPVPNPTLPPPTASVSSVSVGLAAWSGDRIRLADGSEIKVAVPRGWTMDEVTRMPDGWVFTAHSTGFVERALYFLPNGGAATRIGVMYGSSFGVSPDGRVVVASGPTGGSVIAYAVPSFTPIRTVDIGVPSQVIVRDVSDAWALISTPTIEPLPTTAYAWHLGTGDLLHTRTDVTLLGMSDRGLALRRMYPAQQGPLPLGCVDLVPITTLDEVWPDGSCSDDLVSLDANGQISPDGLWAVLNLKVGQEPTMVLVRTDDVDIGVWRPANLNLGSRGRIWFWDSDETFIVSLSSEYNPDRPTTSRYYRCHVTKGCATLTLPTGMTNPMLIRNRGLSP